MTITTASMPTADPEAEVAVPHHRRRHVPLIILGTIAVAGAAVVFTTRSSAKPVAATTQAVERDFQIELSQASAPAGRIRLSVHNSGKTEHELVAFRTDLPEGSLPLDSTGRVNETGPGITHIDPEAESVQPGTTKSVTLDLPAGRYVVICNLPGHYASGMHQVLTVS